MSTTSSSRGNSGAKKLAPLAIVAFVLGVLIAILAVINLDKVPLDLLFGTVNVPLILLIAICVLVGAVLGAAIASGAAAKIMRR